MSQVCEKKKQDEQLNKYKIKHIYSAMKNIGYNERLIIASYRVRCTIQVVKGTNQSKSTQIINYRCKRGGPHKLPISSVLLFILFHNLNVLKMFDFFVFLFNEHTILDHLQVGDLIYILALTQLASLERSVHH